MNVKERIIIIYSTFSNKEEAEKISNILLKEKLIACANIFPAHTAIYEWEGKICNEQEVAVIFKTVKSNINPVKDMIIDNHSYDCPSIISWDINSHNNEYTKWLESSLL